jgi:hypothetical protein
MTSHHKAALVLLAIGGLLLFAGAAAPAPASLLFAFAAIFMFLAAMIVLVEGA